LAARLAKADYSQDFAMLYGPDSFSRPDDALQAVGPWRSSELTHARSSKLTHQTNSNVKVRT
jgi:hypothetical protein